MRNFFIVVLLAGVRVAWTLTEGTPNCPVVGNWSDSEGTKVLGVWSFSLNNASNIGGIDLSVNGYKITHENHNSTTTNIYSNPAFVVLVTNATGPNNHFSTEKTIVQLLCANNILYVDVLPVSDSAMEEMAFALRRSTVLPLNEEPQEPPIASPAVTPQFILVNITLPRRQDDDTGEYMESYSGDEREASLGLSQAETTV
ncbi:hypothetical protein E2C01_016461 [Portunus trituberculatus]|uniref:Uncharacterized protein n=1 Tax=Portunus trituberculatus TaxID=210409 RepID=A0A5B7DR63_PORTR|nr:hypothetical protein [Portunus trituberculatus]